MIDVNAVLFRAAAECQSTEETRYCLNGVYVQPHPVKGAVLTATDGHRLICIYDETGQCAEPKIIRVDPRALASQTKADRKTNQPLRLTVEADGRVSVGTYRSLSSGIVGGAFPDYARLVLSVVRMVKDAKYAPSAFKPGYLASFNKIAGILGSGDSPLKLVVFSPNDPALVLFDTYLDAFALLMPMRARPDNGLPSFIKPFIDAVTPPASPEATTPAAPAAQTASKTAKRVSVARRVRPRATKKLIKPTRKAQPKSKRAASGTGRKGR